MTKRKRTEELQKRGRPKGSTKPVEQSRAAEHRAGLQRWLIANPGMAITQAAVMAEIEAAWMRRNTRPGLLKRVAYLFGKSAQLAAKRLGRMRGGIVAEVEVQRHVEKRMVLLEKRFPRRSAPSAETIRSAFYKPTKHD